MTRALVPPRAPAATAAVASPPPSALDLDEYHLDGILLEDVSWELYEHFLRDFDGVGRHVRVTYDDGRMEIVTLGTQHEHDKTLLGRLIETYALELDIELVGVGSVTLRRKERRKGLEPDECYYVQTPAPKRKTSPLDLKKNPPPDLCIEVDIGNSSLPREPIYAAIGIPEIWRYDGRRVTVLHRRRDGKYRAAARSLAFPKLSMPAVNHFVTMSAEANQHAVVRAFRDWLRAGSPPIPVEKK